jgi:hypothetical protein
MTVKKRHPHTQYPPQSVVRVFKEQFEILPPRLLLLRCVSKDCHYAAPHKLGQPLLRNNFNKNAKLIRSRGKTP